MVGLIILFIVGSHPTTQSSKGYRCVVNAVGFSNATVLAGSNAHCADRSTVVCALSAVAIFLIFVAAFMSVMVQYVHWFW